jgi:hypothetical protein
MMAVHARERQNAVTTAGRGLFAALTRWGQSTQDYISDYLEGAVERFLAVAGAEDLPTECFAVREIALRLAQSWSDWREFAERTQLLRNLPDDRWWDALDALPGPLVALCCPTPPALEPVKQLVDLLNASPGGRMQICRMYGFFDDRGQPHPEWIDEELAKPGSRTGPETGWKHPMARRYEGLSAEELGEMEATIKACQGKRGRLEAVCRETIKELVELGVLMPQVVRMTHKTEAEIRTECAKHGWPVPQQAQSVLTGRHPYEPELKPEDAARFDAERLHDQRQRDEQVSQAAEARMGNGQNVVGLPRPVADEPPSVEQRIISLFQDGGTPATIAKTLREEGVSKERAAAVIKRFEADPEAFVAVQ